MSAELSHCQFVICAMSFYLSAMPVASEDTQKRLFELLVSERVAERVDGTVEIAEPVGDVVDDWLDARKTEAHDHGQHVPRRPAENERSEDNGDGAQSLAGAVLALALLLRQRRRRRRRRRAGDRVVTAPLTAHLRQAA